MMNISGPGLALPSRQLWRIGLAALVCLAIAITVACGSDPTPTPEPEPTVAPATATPEPTAVPTPEPQTAADNDADKDGDAHTNGDAGKVEAPANSDSDEGSGQSSASSSEDSTDNDGGASSGGDGSDSDTVSRENPGSEGMLFDNSRNVALLDAQPLNIVTWTVEPTVGLGELVAEGVLEQDATIFNPTVDGEGSGFSVFYKGHQESMVELLPDLGPLMVWDTFLTVADTEMEIEGASFKIRAYSPLFMDVGSGDLELRVYGYLPSGEDAVLAVQDITGR